MSFRRLDPPQESRGSKVRASIGVARKTGPILTAPSKCTEDGATTKEEEQVT
jgi:hypothetical protein